MTEEGRKYTRRDLVPLGIGLVGGGLGSFAAFKASESGPQPNSGPNTHVIFEPAPVTPASETPTPLTTLNVTIKNVTEYPILEITDRKEYLAAANHLRALIKNVLNPQYSIHFPELLGMFDGLNNLTDRELQNRILMMSTDYDSQTGFENGMFRSTRFVIRDDRSKALMGGEIDEDVNFSSFRAQLDERYNLLHGEVDESTDRFEVDDLGGLLRYFYKVPTGAEINYQGKSSLVLESSEMAGDSRMLDKLFTANTNGFVMLNQGIRILTPTPTPVTY